MTKKSYVIHYIFAAILGVLFHFVYEWSGNNGFVGLFSPVNESTWEHLKLLFFPMLLLTIYDLVIPKYSPEQFLPARTKGIIYGMAFIVIAFYSLSGIIGKSIMAVDILIYFVGLYIVFRAEAKQKEQFSLLTEGMAWVLLFVITLAFFLLTYNPPNLGIFANP